MIDILRETVISTDDVARRLGVTTKTVRNWMARQVGQRLEFAKYGGKVVTTLEALQRFGQHSGSKSKPKRPDVTAQRRHEAAMKHLQEAHGI